MQFTNPASLSGPVTVNGGTIDTVNNPVAVGSGTVNNVSNPVTPDPNGTIAVVSTSVPLPFRDIAFWPCASGESFPPTFANGGGYNNRRGFPTVRATGSVAGAQAFWPFIPRQSFSGKSSVTFSGSAVISSNGTGGTTPTGFGPASSTSMGTAFYQTSTVARRAMIILTKDVTASVNLTVTYSDGTTAVQTGTLVNFAANVSTVHTWAITFNANGDLTVVWDGATVLNVASIWPVTANETPQLLLSMAGSGTAAPGTDLAALQTTWS